MDPELTRLMQENLAIARENNAVLRAIRRHQVVGIWGKVLFWIVITLGSAYGFHLLISTPFTIPGMSTPVDMQTLIQSYQVK